MMEESDKSASQWRVIKESVRGASHLRSGLPNQDSAFSFPEQGGPRVLLAIADGHGSAKYFRSDRGARFAVAAAAAMLDPLLKETLETAGLSAIKRWATDQLPQKLVRAWRERVEEDFTNEKFTSKERNMLIENENPAAWEAVKADNFIPYGSTILAAIVTELFALYVQLGDGDILAVSESGEVTRPIQADQRLMANETTSLCSHKAWDDFRVHFQVLPEPKAAPALILISTDGYANSFRDEQAFTRVGSDLLQMIRFEGLDEIRDKLPEWLNDASKQGSGDDISLGIIAREQAIIQRVLTVSKDEKRPFTYPGVHEAIEKAPPGASIDIEPGTYAYEGTCVIDKPLTINGHGSPGDIKLESGGQPCLSIQADGVMIRNLVLHSQHASTHEKQERYPTVEISADQVRLEACDIIGGTSACIAIHGSGAAPVIRECTIHNSAGSGVQIFDHAYTRIEYSAIYHNQSRGIEFLEESQALVRYCNIYGNKEYGLLVSQNKKATVEECGIYGNGIGGVSIIKGGDLLMQHSKVHDEAGWCVAIWGKCSPTIADCELFNNVVTGIGIGPGSSPTIQRCIIHHGKQSGIMADHDAQGIIEGCEIYENSIGVDIKSLGQLVVRGCRIHHEKQSGIIFQEHAQGLVEDCDIYENEYVGIEIMAQSQPLVRACRINRNVCTAIKVHARAQGTVEKCDLTANRRGAWEDEDSSLLNNLAGVVGITKKLRRSDNKE